jgi:hypothetical protein
MGTQSTLFSKEAHHERRGAAVWQPSFELYGPREALSPPGWSGGTTEF